VSDLLVLETLGHEVQYQSLLIGESPASHAATLWLLHL